MDKKYQIFISSTFEDLKEERAKVINTILRLNHIPVGMEWFTANSEGQFEYIKKMIDNCDYYVLIIAGKYGSEDSKGISYTETEYDYAKSKGLDISTFIYKDRQKLSGIKLEFDEDKRNKLELFIQKASKGVSVDFWTNEHELAQKVSTSLHNRFDVNPQTGWKRANLIAQEDVMSDLIVKNKEVADLKEKLEKIKLQPKFEGLAEMDEEFTFKIVGTQSYYEAKYSWDKIFTAIYPHIIANKNIEEINSLTALDFAMLDDRHPYDFHDCIINNMHFFDILNQLECYQLIKVHENKVNITEAGRDYYPQARAIKSLKSNNR